MLSSRGDSRKGLTTSAGAAKSNLGRGTLRKCLALFNMPELEQISLEEKETVRVSSFNALSIPLLSCRSQFTHESQLIMGETEHVH